MENVKYIPGDLVRSNNNPKITWKVKDVSQDKRGNVLYRLIAVEEEEAFIYLYESQIAQIPLTKEVLEKNGWKILNIYKDDNDFYCKELNCYSWLFLCMDKPKESSFSAGILLSKDTAVGVADLFTYFPIDISYIHQLQHLLFGLGLDSNLKV